VVLIASGEFGAAGFERSLQGRALTFAPSPGSESVMTDRETGSTWSAEGEALAGPLRTSRLNRLDGYLVEWHVWSAYNPGADLFDPSPLVPPRIENAALPKLELQRLDPARAEPLGLPGVVNLVAVWTSWCAPCREELPRLQRLVREHGARGLAAAGLAVLIPEASEVEAVARFVAEAGITFPIYLLDADSYDRFDRLAKETGGPGLVLPTVFVADEQGRILEVLRGKQAEDLASALEKWLPPSGARD
jgi:thiol-disulfide isomerase/thioredoxin